MMRAVIPPLLVPFLEDLGIDPAKVSHLSINCSWDEKPEVAVRFVAEPQQVDVRITRGGERV